MTIPALIPSSAVEINSGRPVTTSLAVAEIFEKRHDNVLQSIDEMECSPGFRALNFQESFRETPTGNGAVRRFRTVEMTKDGFTILAMGYTGAKAMAFKVAYIQRFNEMEAQLQASQPTLTDRLRSSRFLLSFDPAGSMLLQEVPDRAVLVDPDNLASLIGDSASLFSKSLLPRMVNASAVNARPLAPIPPMDNAREGVAVWQYCRDSAAYLFGAMSTDKMVERVAKIITEAGAEGISQADLSKALNRHVKGDRLAAILAELQAAGRVTQTRVDTPGRPAVIWREAPGAYRDSPPWLS
jgi:Rha family phage regulatory protein